MKDIGLILGIRPDVIRASKIIKLLHENSDIDFDFIWSGQHYSENMKDVFFNQLNTHFQTLNSILMSQMMQLLLRQ